MRHVSLATLSAFLIVAVLGCDSEPTRESVMEDSIAKLKELASVLESVKDESSAQAAKPKLQAIDADMKEIKAKAEKMSKPSAEEDKRLEEKYRPQVMEVAERLTKEMVRVGLDPKLGPILKDAMPGDGAAPPLPGM